MSTRTPYQQGPFFITADDPGHDFPDPMLAMEEPNGLLAIGGDLSPQRLIKAYRQGIFPWYNEGQPILWWSPNPRAVLFPGQLKVSRSLSKTLKKDRFVITVDHAFQDVIRACAGPRRDSMGTWITGELEAAYLRLHTLGVAHSVESWVHGELAGGLYGVALGRVFFGESMFHHHRDASKVALVHLVRQLQRWDYRLIDCQVSSGHLASLGAAEIDRAEFLDLLARWSTMTQSPEAWGGIPEPPF